MLHGRGGIQAAYEGGTEAADLAEFGTHEESQSLEKPEPNQCPSESQSKLLLLATEYHVHVFQWVCTTTDIRTITVTILIILLSLCCPYFSCGSFGSNPTHPLLAADFSGGQRHMFVQWLS